MTERAYRSPARDEAKQETRMRILDALVAVVLDDGVHAFTMENVARKAGVTHRTVYRHFATRELLLEGLSELLDDVVAVGGVLGPPKTVDDLVDLIVPVYREFAKRRDVLVASVITSLATRYTTASKKRRWKAMYDIFTAAFPNVPAAQRDEAIEVVNAVSSSLTWFTLTSERKLATDRAGRAVTWALRTLIDDLARRDRAARPR